MESLIDFSGRKKLPIFMASEAAECGLACIAMIASFHGHNIDLNGLRQRFSVSMAGLSLRGLMSLADQLNLSSRPLRADLSAVETLKLPAIVHWGFNHYVVLKSVSSKLITVHDPSIGVRRISIEEFSNSFTGVVLELTPSANFEPLEMRLPVKINSLWSRMEGLGTAVLQIVALSLALQLTTFVAPFQMQLVVDNAIGKADSNALLVISLAFAFIVILQAAIEALRSWALMIFGQLLGYQMLGNLIRHLLRLSPSYFEKRHVGDILSRLSSAGYIQQLLTTGAIATLIDGLMALVSCVILFVYSTTLALIVVSSIAMVMAITFVIFPVMRKRQEEQIVHSAKEQSFLMESVRAIVPIRLMGREQEREAHWRNLYTRVINSSVSLAKWQLGGSTFRTVVEGLQTVLVLFIGARLVIAGNGFSVGMLIAFLSFRQTFTDRAIALVNQLVEFRFMGLHLERLSDIVSAENEVTNGYGSNVLQQSRGELSLNSVGFRYSPSEPHILSNVDLFVTSGSYLAITGPSGGGKSTLVKLMLGLAAPTEGQINIDGIRADAATWRAWRENVGVVMQDDQLLSGTIAENISFFDPDLDMDKVRDAAAAAMVHDEIVGKPMQYMSLIGDMGSSLSGGQRQRILLARALYRNPSVLVLDEGTANLDLETEKRIADAIASMKITRIVVAHRKALVDRADRVLVVRDGLVQYLDDRLTDQFDQENV